MDAIIEIRNLTKIYDMGATEVHALSRVNLCVAPGEYVAIMGPSGSGKSTLLNILGCLDVPTSGSYALGSIRVSDMADDDLARIRNQEIGFVFQTFNLLPRANALGNVELPLIYSGLPAHQRRERAARALESVGLAERIEHRPNELSGGQKQRVAIARSLINEPSIILADEPTGALDSRTGDEIMDLFDQVHAAGNTILLVTHEEPLARRSRRIVRFRDGRIESDCPTEEATR